MRSTRIWAEDYLRNKMHKTNQPKIVDKFSEMVDHFTELYRHKQYKDNETNKSGSDKKHPASEQQVVQPPRNTDH